MANLIFFPAGMTVVFLGIVGFFAYPLIRAYGRKGQALQVRKEKLDRAGVITNVLLALTALLDAV